VTSQERHFFRPLSTINPYILYNVTVNNDWAEFNETPVRFRIRSTFGLGVVEAMAGA
jgi:hypothetical protein